jgi:hypothetical protein
MKPALAFLAFTLLFASTSHAQISCSAKVPAETCQSVNDAFGMLDHQIVPGRSYPVEVLTPDEYKQRVAAFNADDTEHMTEIGKACEGKGNLNTDRCQLFLNTFFTNVLGMGHSRLFWNTFTADVAFVRDTPKSRSPDRIVLSTDSIDERKQEWVKDEKGQSKLKMSIVHGRVSIDGVHSTLHFIIGFITGAESTLLSRAYCSPRRSTLPLALHSTQGVAVPIAVPYVNPI